MTDMHHTYSNSKSTAQPAYRPAFAMLVITIAETGDWATGPLILALGIRSKPDSSDRARSDTLCAGQSNESVQINP